MRNGTAAAGLALALGLASAVPALAEDAPARGNWLTRLFTRPAATKKDAAPATAEAPPVSAGQAKTDWLRRLEVCDKLREIAFAQNDAELARRAERLEQRAWDAYAGRMSQAGDSALDEASLHSRLGPDAVGTRSPLDGPRTRTGEGRAENRR